MTETTQTLRDDIAFMRALADEGARPPLLVGPSMMFAGALWAIACLVGWSGLRFFNASPTFQVIVQVTPIAVFLAVLPFLIHSARNKPGAKSPANKAVGMAWSGAGWGIFLLAGCTFLVCWRAHNGLPAAMMPCEVLVLYGVAWFVAAVMTRDRFLWVTALGSFVCALIVAAVVGTVDEYLVFAITLILVAFIPGCILVRREAKDIV